MLNKPEYIIVHHTGGTNANPLADTSHHTADMVDKYHKSLGWEGIGYHYFIEKDGALKKGRAENYHGAHTVGYNEISLGVCLAGNFDATMPTNAQVKTLRELLLDIKTRYLIPIEKILPHRNFANKSCYGRRLADNWAQSLLMPIGQKVELLKMLDELKKKVELL